MTDPRQAMIDEQERRAKIDAAVEHTRRIEAEFSQRLCDLGWSYQTDQQERDTEDRVLGEFAMQYGDAAADHLRRNTLPVLGKDSSVARSPRSPWAAPRSV